MAEDTTTAQVDRKQKVPVFDKIADGYHDGKREAEDEERARAAATIQKAWRQQNSRARLQKEYLSSEIRWKDAAQHAILKVHRTSADAGKNSVKERWTRGAFFASKIRDGNSVMNKPDMDDPNSLPVQKHLETQHWLELIDS
ncbi:hypothetical protein EV361DRAFT_792045 [Lentinula raphanica]|uniref:Uncharacterized protein n=1 Tax=Lentinula raphanica TaxID=153919 RepID=A0AA38UMK2_9AGAR|nr:hypothetical protein F5878DRAFT_145455 [Lentinula raphanica]KAJ3975572.1 hypothetical protein EV361DRAFT_792045 [Lentinula raphanica]